MINTPRISIIIRNKNEAEHLRYLLPALRQQTFQDFEIIIVDNKSTDDSLRLAAEAGATVVSLSDFTYGRALNLGISRSRGELIVILSAHSIPLGPDFLTACVRPFDDERVAAGRLVYFSKGADAVRWLDPEVLTDPDCDFVSKGPLGSGCVIRRSVWEQIRFDEDVIAAEDKIWSAAVLKAGYSIVSPVPAFYYYRKSLPPVSEVRKNYRELIAIYNRFGFTLGFVNLRRRSILTEFIRASMYTLKQFAREVKGEALKAYLIFKFPKP